MDLYGDGYREYANVNPLFKSNVNPSRRHDDCDGPTHPMSVHIVRSAVLRDCDCFFSSRHRLEIPEPPARPWPQPRIAATRPTTRLDSTHRHA
jgi:hypothetical protein